MTGSDQPTDRVVAKILALIAGGDATLADGEPATLRVIGAGGIRRRRVDRATLAALVAADLIAEHRDAAASAVRLCLTAAGVARVRRGSDGAADFRRQHGAVAERAPLAHAAPLRVDEAESPLAWLARRRDKDGRPYLSPARLAAGERLRADFTLARMMPTMTSNWSSGRVSAGNGGPGDRLALTDRALAARDRVRAALEAVGSDLAGVLLDVCCFLKGLETIESDRRWPVRSAKVVLDIALGRLADHYGLGDEARGRDRARAITAWGSGDHRPTLTGDRA